MKLESDLIPYMSIPSIRHIVIDSMCYAYGLIDLLTLPQDESEGIYF